MWRRPSKGRRKLPLQALAPPNNQAMEGNFGCLLLVGWVGRGGWLVGSGGTSVQLPWPSNTVHKLAVVKRSFEERVFFFQNTRVFRISWNLQNCSSLLEMEVTQTNKLTAVQTRTSSSRPSRRRWETHPKTKTHTKILIYKGVLKEKVISIGQSKARD